MRNETDVFPVDRRSAGLAYEEEYVLTHAQAEALRRRKERQGKISAFVIAAVVHAVVILILTLIVLPAMQVERPPIIARMISPTEGTIDSPITRQTVRQRPTAPSTSARVLTTHSPTASIFAPTVPMVTETMDLGLGASLGLGIGMTGDGQEGLTGIPDRLRGRCTEQERMKRLREGGGTQEVELAVRRALRWFQANQNEDGSWGRRAKAGMTGLALLAYFGHCETHQSREYGTTVSSGMAYLINLGRENNGMLAVVGGHGTVYEHAIATYALSEALTFVNELKVEFPGLQETVERAVRIILDGQSPSGFWHYGYDRSHGGDLSITGWHLQALKAAEHAGFGSPELTKVVNRALERTIEVQADDGTFGYRHRAPTGDRLVGVGVLSLQMFGRGNTRAARDGLRWMNRNMEPIHASANTNLYGWYYASLALFHRGAGFWDKWNRTWRDEMLRAQNEDGSWPEEGGFDRGGVRSTKSAGPDADFYRNGLNTLSLQVYYRFLPGTGGG